MSFNNFLKFYEDNREKLLLTDGLRPAKSVTRTIITSVEKFVDWYKKTGETFLSYNVIANEILNLTESGKSTIEDNIRNMKEIQFLIQLEQSKNYQFTRNFINFVYSNNSLEEYILNELRKVDSIDNLNMFYNYILVTLREAIIKGHVTLYPDSVEKFHNAVKDKNTRIKILNEIYNLYGFKSRSSYPNDDDYTPNINYRILSTIRNLGLLNEAGQNEYGFQIFTLSKKGEELLNQIDKNLELYNNYDNVVLPKEEKIIEVTPVSRTERTKGEIFEDIYDEIYLAQSNDVLPEKVVNILNLDMPQPIANTFARSSTRRDPVKAANAKAVANYLCEHNNQHATFTNKATNRNYVEAHHLIPMQLQSKFFYSLDIEANIVSLCPVCHRMIHHATNEEKREIITKLYNERVERLRKCNIYIELVDLLNFYFGNTEFS